MIERVDLLERITRDFTYHPPKKDQIDRTAMAANADTTTVPIIN